MTPPYDGERAVRFDTDGTAIFYTVHVAPETGAITYVPDDDED